MFQYIFFFVLLNLFPAFADLLFDQDQKIVLASKKIYFEDYPEAFNPSIIKYDQGYLLTFRYTPMQRSSFISYVGIVLLDENFDPVSKPDLLLTRHRNSITQSQSEDARLFSYRGRIYIIYNDNVDVNNPSIYDRRDMFIAEVFYSDHHFSLSAPLKLCCQEKISQLWQKNWVPFEWNNVLYLSYSLNPHEVLYLNLTNGECYSCYKSEAPIHWEYGTLRGSSAATTLDGEYLAFFHSGTVMSSPASFGQPAWHYFMGAYTFSADPPFKILRISEKPIVAEGYYDPCSFWKKVIFPGGYVVEDSYIYVAYGKHDSEMWIATLDKDALMESLLPIKIK